jgi:hypothetical protein
MSEQADATSAPRSVLSSGRTSALTSAALTGTLAIAAECRSHSRSSHLGFSSSRTPRRFPG